MGPLPTGPLDPRLELLLGLASAKRRMPVNTDGFAVALILGLIALLSPVLWIAWWLLADLGERASGAYSTRYRASAEPKLRRLA